MKLYRLLIVSAAWLLGCASADLEPEDASGDSDDIIGECTNGDNCTVDDGGKDDGGKDDGGKDDGGKDDGGKDDGGKDDGGKDDGGKDDGGKDHPSKDDPDTPVCTDGYQECEDAKTLRTCVNGKFQSSSCADSCQNAQCISINSCAAPLEIDAVNDENGSQAQMMQTGENYSIQSSAANCNRFKGNLTVSHISVPKTDYYTIAVNSDADDSWGFVESLSCSSSIDLYQNLCNINDKQVTRLLNAGDFYFFVGLLLDSKNSNFNYDISVAKAASNQNACGYQGALTVVDATQPSHHFSDTLKDAERKASGGGSSGSLADRNCITASSNKDKGYAFQITQKTTLRATLSVDTAKCSVYDEDKKLNVWQCTNNASLYIHQCDKGITGRKAITCEAKTLQGSETSENAATLTLNTELSPGEYILFVDSDGMVNEDYEYSLEMAFD